VPAKNNNLSNDYAKWKLQYLNVQDKTGTEITFPTIQKLLESSFGVKYGPMQILNHARSFGVQSQKTTESLSTPYGNLFTFMYKADPKVHHWDVFPIIILLDVNKDSMFGVNLHYLHPKLRYLLLRRLKKITTTNKYSQQNRYLLTYRMIQRYADLKMFKFALKRYRFDRTYGKLTRIPLTDWGPMIYAPLETFMKVNKATIHSRSLKA
jgi:hypothetical protein